MPPKKTYRQEKNHYTAPIIPSLSTVPPPLYRPCPLYRLIIFSFEDATLVGHGWSQWWPGRGCGHGRGAQWATPPPAAPAAAAPPPLHLQSNGNYFFNCVSTCQSWRENNAGIFNPGGKMMAV